jgi:hypothetical protein
VPARRTNSEARQKQSPRLRPEPKLEVAGAVFPQQAVLGLVDDWIAPSLVEEFLRYRMNLRVPPDATIMGANYEMRHLCPILFRPPT